MSRIINPLCRCAVRRSFPQSSSYSCPFSKKPESAGLAQLSGHPQLFPACSARPCQPHRLAADGFCSRTGADLYCLNLNHRLNRWKCSLACIHCVSQQVFKTDKVSCDTQPQEAHCSRAGHRMWLSVRRRRAYLLLITYNLLQRPGPIICWRGRDILVSKRRLV